MKGTAKVERKCEICRTIHREEGERERDRERERERERERKEKEFRNK